VTACSPRRLSFLDRYLTIWIALVRVALWLRERLFVPARPAAATAG